MSYRHLIGDEAEYERMFQSSRSIRHFGDKIHRAVQHERYDMAKDALDQLASYFDVFEAQIEAAPDWTKDAREAKQ